MSSFAAGGRGQSVPMQAMRAAGVDLKRLYRPIGVISFLSFGLTLALMLLVVPFSNRLLYALKLQLSTMVVADRIQPGVFSQEIAGRRFYVESASLDRRELRGLIVADRSEPGVESLTLAERGRIEVEIAGAAYAFVTQTAAEKTVAFHKVYWALRRLPEREMRAKVQEIAAAAGFDAAGLCRDLVMSWDEVRALAQDPLVTIAAHTVNHLAIAKLPADEARREIAESVRRVKEELGQPCRHFSFPYGDATSAGARDFEIARSLGLVTAVTTHKDVIQAGDHDLCGLPRVSLNGNFQKSRYVRVFLSGAPFALVRLLKQVKARLKGQPQRQPAPAVQTATG